MDYYKWTQNPVPHWGNQLRYKTDKEHEVEYLRKRVEELENDRDHDSK